MESIFLLPKTKGVFDMELKAIQLTKQYGSKTAEYYGTAEPPVRCGESHPSGLTEPLHFVY